MDPGEQIQKKKERPNLEDETNGTTFETVIKSLLKEIKLDHKIFVQSIFNFEYNLAALQKLLPEQRFSLILDSSFKELVEVSIRLLNQNKIDESLNILANLEELLIKRFTKEYSLLVIIFNYIGVCYKRKNAYELSLRSFNKALATIKSQNLKSYRGMTYNNMTALYSYINNHSKANETAKSALYFAEIEFLRDFNKLAKDGSDSSNREALDLVTNYALAFFYVGLEEEYLNHYDDAHLNLRKSLAVLKENWGLKHPLYPKFQKEFDRLDKKCKERLNSQESLMYSSIFQGYADMKKSQSYFQDHAEYEKTVRHVRPASANLKASMPNLGASKEPKPMFSSKLNTQYGMKKTEKQAFKRERPKDFTEIDEKEDLSYVDPKILTDESFDELEKYTRLQVNNSEEKNSKSRLFKVTNNSENKVFRKNWANFSTGTSDNVEKQLVDENASLKSLLFNRESELRDTMASLTYLRNIKKLPIIFEKEQNRYYFRKQQDFEAVDVHIGIEPGNKLKMIENKRHGWLTVYLNMETKRLTMRFDSFAPLIKSYERNFDVSYIFKQVKFIKAAHLESKNFLIIFEDIVDVLLREMRIYSDTNITLSQFVEGLCVRYPLTELKGIARDAEVFWRPLEFIIKKFEPNDELFVEETQQKLKEKYNRVIKFIKKCIFRRRILTAVAAANYLYASEIYILKEDIVVWFRFWRKVKWNEYRVKFMIKKLNDDLFNEINGGFLFDFEMKVEKPLAMVMKESSNHLIFFDINIETEKITLSKLGTNFEKLRNAMTKQGNKLQIFKKQSFKAIKFYYLKKMIDISEESWIPGLFTRVRKILWETGVDIFAVLESLNIDLNMVLKEDQFSKVFDELQNLLSLSTFQIRRLKLILTKKAGGKEIKGQDLIEVFISHDSWVKYQMSKLVEMLSVKIKQENISLYEFFQKEQEIITDFNISITRGQLHALLLYIHPNFEYAEHLKAELILDYFYGYTDSDTKDVILLSSFISRLNLELLDAKGHIANLKRIIIRDKIKMNQIFKLMNVRMESQLDFDQFAKFLKYINISIRHDETGYLFSYFTRKLRTNIPITQIISELELKPKTAEEILNKLKKIINTEAFSVLELIYNHNNQEWFRVKIPECLSIFRAIKPRISESNLMVLLENLYDETFQSVPVEKLLAGLGAEMKELDMVLANLKDSVKKDMIKISSILQGEVPKNVDFYLFKRIVKTINPSLRSAQIGLLFQICVPRQEVNLKEQPKELQKMEERVINSKTNSHLSIICNLFGITSLEEEISAVRRRIQDIVKRENMLLYEFVLDILGGVWSEEITFENFKTILKSIAPSTTLAEMTFLFSIYDRDKTELIKTHTFVGQFTRFESNKEEMMHYTENLKRTFQLTRKDYNVLLQTLKYSLKSELNKLQFHYLVLAIDPTLRNNSIEIMFLNHKTNNDVIDLYQFSNLITDPKEELRAFKEEFEKKINEHADFIMIALEEKKLRIDQEIDYYHFDLFIRRIEPTLIPEEIKLAFDIYSENKSKFVPDTMFKFLRDYEKIKDTPMRILKRLQDRVVKNEFSMYEIFVLAHVDIRVEKLNGDQISKILKMLDGGLSIFEISILTRKIQSIFPADKPAALFLLETLNANPKELQSLFDVLKRSVAEHKVNVLAHFLQIKLNLEKDKINYEKFKNFVLHFLGSQLRTEQIYLIFCHLEPLMKDELPISFLLDKLEISLEVVENLVVNLKNIVKRNKISVFKVLTLLGIEPSHKILFGDFNKLIKTIDSSMLKEHVQLMFSHLDKNGNGELELQEFMKIILDEEKWESKQASKILEDLKIYANRSQISLMELIAQHNYPPDTNLEFIKFERLLKSIDQNISRDDANLVFQMLRFEQETDQKSVVKVDQLLTELNCVRNEGSRILKEFHNKLKASEISILEIMAKLDLQRNNLIDLNELTNFFRAINATIRPEQATIVFWEYADPSKNKIALGRIVERLRWDENEEDNIKKKFANLVKQHDLRFLGLLMEAENEDKELLPDEMDKIFRNLDNTLRGEEIKIIYQIAREEKGGLLTVRNLREFFYPSRDTEPDVFEKFRLRLENCIETRKISTSELIIREELSDKVTPQQFKNLLDVIDPLLFTSGEKELIYTDLLKRNRGSVEVRTLKEALFPTEDIFEKVRDYLRRKIKKLKISLPNLLKYLKYDLKQVLSLEDTKKIINIIDPFLRKEQITLFYKEFSYKNPTGVELIELLTEDQRETLEFCVDEYMSELRARARANKQNLDEILSSLNLSPDKVMDLNGLRKIVREIYPSFSEQNLQMMISHFDTKNESMFLYRDFMKLLSIDVFEADKAREDLSLIINIDNLNIFEMLPKFDLYDPKTEVDFPRFKDLILEVNRSLRKDVVKTIYHQFLNSAKNGLTVDKFLQTLTGSSYNDHLDNFLLRLRKALERNDISIKEMVLGFNVQETSVLSFSSFEEIAKKVFWGLRRDQALFLFHILKRNPHESKIHCEDFLERFKVNTDNVVKDILEILASRVKYQRIKVFDVYKIFCNDFFGEIKYDEFERVIKVIDVSMKKEDIIILFQYLLRGKKFDIRDEMQGIKAIDFFDRLGYKDRYLEEIIRSIREKIRVTSTSLTKLLPISSIEDNPLYTREQFRKLTETLKMKMEGIIEFVYDNLVKKVNPKAKSLYVQDALNFLFDEKWSEEFARIGELIRNLRGRVLYDNLNLEEVFARCKVSLESLVTMEQFVKILGIIDYTLDKPTVVLLFRYFDFSVLWKINGKYLNNSLSPMGEQLLKATEDKFVQIPGDQELIDDVQDSVNKLNLTSTATALRAVRDTFKDVKRSDVQTKKKI